MNTFIHVKAVSFVYLLSPIKINLSFEIMIESG